MVCYAPEALPLYVHSESVTNNARYTNHKISQTDVFRRRWSAASNSNHQAYAEVRKRAEQIRCNTSSSDGTVLPCWEHCDNHIVTFDVPKEVDVLVICVVSERAIGMDFAKGRNK